MCSIPAEGYIGDVSWIIAGVAVVSVAHRHGVLMTALAKAADIVFAGASWVEKDGAFVNGEGRLQAASRAINPPGEAQEDWQIFVNVGLALGAPVTYTSSAAVRADLAAAMGRWATSATGLATLRVRAAYRGAPLAAGV